MHQNLPEIEHKWSEIEWNCPAIEHKGPEIEQKWPNIEHKLTESVQIPEYQSENDQNWDEIE